VVLSRSALPQRPSDNLATTRLLDIFRKPPGVNVDLYTPVSMQIAVATPVVIP
jgi:hypothetical protein